ncbi:ferrochelatase [Amaricoccus solimangrovi]|uniref:Ferrochelatase n=1 Tax=Amaricoccus solimangrovi TaxID=2589815 RepID=A0A501WS88_9RHOB|nr:ferrochelatase [Amaricoccus solimangrovi]TPE52238.1 ferrochelatase [Amaricoccus solimangrovi]
MTDSLKPGEGRLAFAPADHPAVPPARIGVILSNLGTPDATDYRSMRRYLGEFLSDQRVIDYPRWKWQPLLQLVILSRRPFSSGKNYEGIWDKERDESPLLTITRAQTRAVAEALTAAHGDRIIVDFAMRYGNPSTESVIGKLVGKGCERIVFFPLYPQYAAPTTATANDQAFRALMKQRWQPAFRTVPAYYDEPLYIEALAGSVERAYAGLERRPEMLLTSYHGMPERYLALGDPYHCQCQATTRRLRERLGFPAEEVRVTFQSKFGPEEWLKPYTVEEVARLAKAGVRRLAVIAPAFSADCVETLEEIRGEIRHAFEAAGGEEFTYIPCLNDDPAHVRMLVTILERELSGWL